MADLENDILNDDDALLMLRAAGELGDVESRQLDARLARDASLQERFAAIVGVDEKLRSEASLRPVVAADSRRALAGSIRLVREQALLMQNRPTIRIKHRRFAFNGWAIGSAVAACLAVGLVVWISNSDPSPLKPGPVPVAMGNDDSHKDEGEIAAAFGTAAVATGEPTASESSASEIDSQVDALDMLAVMTEPN